MRTQRQMSLFLFHTLNPYLRKTLSLIPYTRITQKLGKIYRALVLVDQRLALYSNYESQDHVLWDKYFRVTTDEIKKFRDTLVTAYRNCRDNGVCNVDIPDKIDGLILEDIFTNGKTVGQNVPILYTQKDEIKRRHRAENFDYISLNCSSLEKRNKFCVPDRLALEFCRNIHCRSVFQASEACFQRAVADQGVYPKDQDAGSIFMEAYRESVSPDQFTRDGKFSVDAIRDLRSKVGQSTYIARYRTMNGQQIDETLGRPAMQDCPAYRPHT